MRGTGSGERGAPRRPPEKGDVTGTWSGCCGTRPVSSRSAACRRRLLCSGHRASKPASSDGRPSAVTCPSPSARLPPPAPSPRMSARHHPDNPGSLPAATPWTRTHLRSPFDSRGGTFAGSGIGHAHLWCGHYSVVSSSMCFLSKGPRAGPIRKDRLHSRGSPLAPPPARSRWNPPTPSLRLSAQAVPGRWVVCSFPETRT